MTLLANIDLETRIGTNKGILFRDLHLNNTLFHTYKLAKEKISTLI